MSFVQQLNCKTKAIRVKFETESYILDPSNTGAGKIITMQTVLVNSSSIVPSFTVFVCFRVKTSSPFTLRYFVTVLRALKAKVVIHL